MTATVAGSGWFLLFRTVRRAVPSAHHSTSPHVRAAASDRLSRCPPGRPGLPGVQFGRVRAGIWRPHAVLSRSFNLVLTMKLRPGWVAVVCDQGWCPTRFRRGSLLFLSGGFQPVSLRCVSSLYRPRSKPPNPSQLFRDYILHTGLAAWWFIAIYVWSPDCHSC